MDWLNYNHLYYFWVVAREGSVAAAARALDLTHPTISKQLSELERSLGGKLFHRKQRSLTLTEFGRRVFHYANEIFALGQELQNAVHGDVDGRPVRFSVGVTEVLPKLVACALLRPAFEVPEPVHIICREGHQEELLTALATHRLDLVLADAPVVPSSGVRAFNHPLGDCGVTFFGPKPLGDQLRGEFPQSLHGAPMLLPVPRTSLRLELERWFDAKQIRPQIIAEFTDTALMKAFGQEGMGLFPSPTIIEREVCRQYHVEIVGRLESVRERFYAISAERRVKHPAVIAICEQAAQVLFRQQEDLLNGCDS